MAKAIWPFSKLSCLKHIFISSNWNAQLYEAEPLFICYKRIVSGRLYLLASLEYEQVDPALYTCGQGLITALLRERLSSVPEVIHSVKVERQFKRIDILCTISDKYVILIEDKTTSKNSKHQLANYLELITKNILQRLIQSSRSILKPMISRHMYRF